MHLGPRIRYVLGWLLTIGGALVGSITADALDVAGAVAWYGFVFAVGAPFLLAATALTASIRPGELRRPGQSRR